MIYLNVRIYFAFDDDLVLHVHEHFALLLFDHLKLGEEILDCFLVDV